MKGRQLTVIVLFAALTVLIGYDVIIIYWRGYEATISWTMLAFAKDYPIVPFALGILFGHLYFPNQMPPRDKDIHGKE